MEEMETEEKIETLEKERSERQKRYVRVNKLSEEEYLDYRDRLADQYYASSPLDNDQGKRALSETLATLIMHMRTLIELQAEAKLAAEEARTLPSVASNIKRITMDLKLVGKVKQEDDPFDV